MLCYRGALTRRDHATRDRPALAAPLWARRRRGRTRRVRQRCFQLMPLREIACCFWPDARALPKVARERPCKRRRRGPGTVRVGLPLSHLRTVIPAQLFCLPALLAMRGVLQGCENAPLAIPSLATSAMSSQA